MKFYNFLIYAILLLLLTINIILRIKTLENMNNKRSCVPCVPKRYLVFATSIQGDMIEYSIPDELRYLKRVHLDKEGHIYLEYKEE